MDDAILWELPSPAGTVVRSIDAVASLAGLIPVIGMIPNMIALILNIILGDIIGAVLSAGSLIPVIGIFPNIMKLVYLVYFAVASLF